jgi:hypothetical protein
MQECLQTVGGHGFKSQNQGDASLSLSLLSPRSLSSHIFMPPPSLFTMPNS